MPGFDEVRESIGEEGVTLVITPTGEATAMNREILKYLTVDRGIRGVYISVTQPYGELREALIDDGIEVDRLHVIDTVSVDRGIDHEEGEDVTYLKSPGHLTDISIGMKEAMKKIGKDESFLFFDTISALEGPVDQFSDFLTGKLRKWNVTGVILSVERDRADQDLLDHLRGLVDHVVDTRE